MFQVKECLIHKLAKTIQEVAAEIQCVHPNSNVSGCRFTGSGVQSKSCPGWRSKFFLQFCTQGLVVVVGCRNIDDPTRQGVGA